MPKIRQAEKAAFAFLVSLFPSNEPTTIAPPTPRARPGIWTINMTGTAIDDADSATPPNKLPTIIPSNNDANCIANIVNTEGIKYW